MPVSDVARPRSPRRGSSRWREICEEYERFVGTQAEFYRPHGITCGSLRYWRLKQDTIFVEVAPPETAAWDVELVFGDGSILLCSAQDRSWNSS